MGLGRREGGRVLRAHPPWHVGDRTELTTCLVYLTRKHSLICTREASGQGKTLNVAYTPEAPRPPLPPGLGQGQLLPWSPPPAVPCPCWLTPQAPGLVPSGPR